uniref:Uncharacterized protein n=1 Tax=Sphaerodactylus townsendi TaxID=933632 RepID=A0ACB8FGV0_9SAUR
MLCVDVVDTGEIQKPDSKGQKLPRQLPREQGLLIKPAFLNSFILFLRQDPKYPVDNLLLEEGLRPWLSGPQDRSRLLKVELQLEQASLIGYIDIGNCGSAFLQIDVGRSSWPADKSYLTLLPTATLMTPADAKLDCNRSGVRMFKKGDFLASALGEKWDRVRVTCSQPFNKQAQFGLSFVRIRTPSDDDSSKAHLPSSPAQGPPEATDSPWLSSAAICRTFFPQAPVSSTEEAALKTRLQQLDPASSPGTQSPVCLSRPARMVLKAAKARKRTFPPVDTPTRLTTESKEQAPPAEDMADSCPASGSRQESSTRRDRMRTKRRRGLCQGAARSVAASSVRPRLGSRRGGRGRGRFPIRLLPAHASRCGEEFEASVSSSSSSSSWEEPPDDRVCCPICQFHFSAVEVEAHASSCGELPDSSSSWLWVEQGD